MATQTHYRACHLCEAICGLEITTDQGDIVSIKGDKNDPLSEGHICPKAVALQDIHDDPDRLRLPMIRNGEEWKQASWDEAFSVVVEKLHDIYQSHGVDAIGIYQGNPSIHNYGIMTHAGHFLGHIKTKNRFSATSVDQLPHQLIAYLMYNHQLIVPIPDIDNTDFFLMLGANPMASNGSLMTVPNFRGRLKKLQKRGGQLIVIDPRVTETAELADQHCFIRPGSDAAFLMGFLKHLIESNKIRLRHLENALIGWDKVTEFVQQFEWSAITAFTSINETTIKQLADQFFAADSAVIYGRMGCSTQSFGSLCQWLIQLINIATGNLDREGGALLPLPAFDPITLPMSRPGNFSRWKSRVRELPEFGGELPVSALAEEIQTPGERQIRALVTVAGNPVLSTPNGVQLDKQLEQLDFIVSVDPYLNETTRHAHVILPPTSPLEHDHYDMIFHAFAVRNTTRYSEALFEKPEGSLHDWEIFTELGKRWAAKTDKPTKPDMRPDEMLDFALQAGPYGSMQQHEQGLSLQKLKDSPSGIDLGALKPGLLDRIPAKAADANEGSSKGQINCVPEELESDLSRLLQKINGDQAELLLIGRRHVRSNNSWMHNYQRLVKGKPRCTLMMHPTDAARYDLNEGDDALVATRVNELKVPVEITDKIMPGVISIPHGWGHNRAGTKLGIASSRPGVSANDLTDDQDVDAVSGNAVLNGVPVIIRKA